MRAEQEVTRRKQLLLFLARPPPGTTSPQSPSSSSLPLPPGLTELTTRLLLWLRSRLDITLSVSEGDRRGTLQTDLFNLTFFFLKLVLWLTRSRSGRESLAESLICSKWKDS